MEDCLSKIEVIRRLITSGTADSLNIAIDSIGELREIVIHNQFVAALDETCSVVSDFKE